MSKQKYKFSMFMKSIQCSNGDLLLYSSYLGVDKIVKVSSESARLLLDWMNTAELGFQDIPLFT